MDDQLAKPYIFCKSWLRNPENMGMAQLLANLPC